jgi:hypothetical protein
MQQNPKKANYITTVAKRVLVGSSEESRWNVEEQQIETEHKYSDPIRRPTVTDSQLVNSDPGRGKGHVMDSIMGHKTINA